MIKVGAVNRCTLCGRLIQLEKLELRPFGLFAFQGEIDCCATCAGVELRRRAKLTTARAGRFER